MNKATGFLVFILLLAICAPGCKTGSGRQVNLYYVEGFGYVKDLAALNQHLFTGGPGCNGNCIKEYNRCCHILLYDTGYIPCMRYSSCPSDKYDTVLTKLRAVYAKQTFLRLQSQFSAATVSEIKIARNSREIGDAIQNDSTISEEKRTTYTDVLNKVQVKMPIRWIKAIDQVSRKAHVSAIFDHTDVHRVLSQTGLDPDSGRCVKSIE